MPRPVKPRNRRRAAPHLVRAGRLRRHRHHPVDARVRPTVIDVGILADRVELAARRLRAPRRPEIRF